MALATQCPHCGKRFRVAADQLKLYGGIVRCGACQEIFDGNASLIDFDAPAAPAVAASPVVPADAGTHAEPIEAGQASTDSPHPGVVPADAGTHAEPIEAGQASTDSPHPDVVPAEAGTHAESIEAGQASTDSPHPDVVPAEAGTHAESIDAAPASTDAPDPDSDAIPVYTLDFDHMFDPLGILPKPAQDEASDEDAPIEAAVIEPEFEAEPEPEPEPESEPEVALAPEPAALAAAEPEPASAAQTAAPPTDEPAHHQPLPAGADRTEPTFDLPVDEELVAAPLPGDDRDDLALHAAGPRLAAADGDGPAPLPMREAAGADFTSATATRPARPRVADARAGRRSKLTPTKISAPKLRAPEIDEPEFVRRSRQQEQSGNTQRILLAAGSLVLLLALATQLAVSFRNVLAARYPAAKPALAATCKLFGCRVELPAQIENLVIETGELTTLGGSTYALTTLLRNQGSLAQAWPRIELALTDANDKPLLRRVFTPAEYLPQGATPAAGFPARAEQPVKLYFQLDQLKPSGYHIAVFYP